MLGAKVTLAYLKAITHICLFKLIFMKNLFQDGMEVVEKVSEYLKAQYTDYDMEQENTNNLEEPNNIKSYDQEYF